MSSEKFEPNPGQQQVYDHKSGPLLVVAGAGTGKTRAITEKISKLLSEGVKPENILAVTFTEKAAAEMSERVQEGQRGLLLDLPIMTYNGYGDRILREFGIHIGLPRTFRLLTSQAAIVFMRERIDQFRLDYFLPLTTVPDSIIEDILGYFSKLKQHIVTPEAYLKFSEGLTSEDEAQSADKRMHQELAVAYDTYIKLCRTENVIDYDDQIFLSIQLIESRPNVQQILKKRYHTVFVDEFQDTNPMQSRFIDLLVPESRNLIVVGDDDQAIYGFRGATISNILNFKQHYTDADDAVLTINYRSHQSILDAAYKLIQNNNPNRLEASLGLNKRLTSNRPGNQPQLFHFAENSQELDWLASDIQRRLESHNPNEKISIAVLARSNNGVQAVHQALSTHAVEHRVIGLTPDLYSRPVIRMIIELIRTITEPGNDASLHHTLIGELFGLSNSLIAPYAKKARYEHEDLEDLLAKVPDAAVAIGAIRKARENAASQSVGMLLWQFLKDSGFTERLLEIAPTDDAAGHALGNLSQFFDTLKEFENIATQPTTAQYQLALPALMAAGQSTDDTLGLTENEIVVTTVHKAKGLEWDTVYLPQLTEQKFPMWKQGGGIELPEDLRSRSLSDADEHYSEERRVMYVAVTRARQNLLLSFADGARKPSRFIDEMFGKGTAEGTPYTDVVSSRAHLDSPVDDIQKVEVPLSIYDGKTVTLDVTKAQTLLNCPLNFYYKYVLQVPKEPGAAADYGTRMHSFIQEINENLYKKEDLRPLEDMIEDLAKGWHKFGYASKSQQERALNQAKSTLTSFYKQATTSPAPIAVEDEFYVEIADNLVLDGRIDAVYDNDGIEIRDYKTGYAAKDETEAKAKAGESRQLELYALAWLTKTGELPVKLSLHYVDTNSIGYANKRVSTIERRREQLIAAADNIRQGNFPLGSSHRYCVHPPVSET